MNYCPNCGKEVNNQSYVCLNCGYKIKNEEENASILWGILGYFIPLAGLIVYLCYMDIKPNVAKMAGKGALISVIVNVVLSIILILLFINLVFSGSN